MLGSGYVGLPAAALFANASFKVVTACIKPEVFAAVNVESHPSRGAYLEELVSRNVQVGRLKATLNPTETLTRADTVIISVQTPIDQNKKPNLSFPMETLKEVGNSTCGARYKGYKYASRPLH